MNIYYRCSLCLTEVQQLHHNFQEIKLRIEVTSVKFQISKIKEFKNVKTVFYTSEKSISRNLI